MNADDLKKMMASGKPVHLIDVREKEEYDAAPGSLRSKNIPMGKMFVEEKKGALPKGEKIVTICKSGKRCEIVARELREMGYDIEHLEGGLDTMSGT